jgi:putative solute:sodium symporter small subunit
MQLSERHRLYWQRTQSLTLALLLVWFVITFGAVFFARELRFTFLGWPFSFYMAAQGSLIGCLAIILLYARRQRKRDVEFGVEEAEDA